MMRRIDTSHCDLLRRCCRAFAQEPCHDSGGCAAPTWVRCRPVWSFFGYDEPNYTYMKDGKKLLSELAAPSPVTGACPRTQPSDHRRRDSRA